MTATATSTSQKISEWLQIFPGQVTDYTSSVTFMKQLTFVAISTITYLRNIFPENCFNKETLGGLSLKTLKKTCSDEQAQFFSTNLTDSFEALDNKYLHQLVLCFSKDEWETQNLTECHIFEYTYNPCEVTMDDHSINRYNVKKLFRWTLTRVQDNTISLLRTCILVLKNQPFVKPTHISIRLYYNEDAPEGYLPPGFLSTMDVDDHLESCICKADRWGSMDTPHHKLVTKIYTKENTGASNDEAIPTENQYAESLERMASDQTSVPATLDLELRCPCKMYGGVDVNNTMHLITCKFCNKVQHASCFGLLTVNESHVNEHCCTECYDSDPTRKPTDPKLIKLTARKRECLSIFRRTLEICSQVTTIGGQRLIYRLGVSETIAKNLMRLLTSYGIILRYDNADPLAPRKINMDRLKLVVNDMFIHTAEDTIVDRLLAETVAQTDPVEDILSPMEKTSLRNDSNLGQVIDSPIQTPLLEDATMKEYRDALPNMTTEAELPLSGSHNPVKDVEKVGKRCGKRKAEGENEKMFPFGTRPRKPRLAE